jgi:hypothetical protein
MIPGYYLVDDFKHIVAAAPHPQKAIVDPLKLLKELKEDNNESSNVINVDPKDLCGQIMKTEPEPQKPKPPSK